MPVVPPHRELPGGGERPHHDTLTGLLDRTGLRNVLENSGILGPEVGLVYLNLGGFRPANERHGYDIGDQIIVEVAQRLRAAVRCFDIVARIGSDEFAVVVGVGAEALPALAARLSRVVTRPLATVDVGSAAPPVIDVTVGCAFGHAGLGLELLRRADVALAAARIDPDRAIATYDAPMAALDADRRRTEAELPRAIANDELVLHVQPIVDLATNDIVGLEALVRWQHPEEGLLLPDSFVPVAERSDLIVELDRWVLTRSFQLIEQIPPSWYLSVNVSGRYLATADLAFSCAELVGGLADPGRLQIEITETDEAIDTEWAVETAHSLRQLGLGLALDDFGTGFSSLTHLVRMPVTAVKIDRSIIELLDSPQGRGVIDVIVGYGQAQGLAIIAEGVTTSQQATDLLARGCRLAQGFHFGEPAPIEHHLERARPT